MPIVDCDSDLGSVESLPGLTREQPIEQANLRTERRGEKKLYHLIRGTASAAGPRGVCYRFRISP